jgi:uncharacterized membrane protein
VDNFVVVGFPDEEGARAGLRALEELHREAAVTVYDTALLRRDAGGVVAVDTSDERRHLGLAMGSLAGALVGVLRGPAGAAIGVAAGGARDFAHAVVRDQFLEHIERDVQRGGCALVAQVLEDSPDIIDARMAALGGTVTRQGREEFVESYLQESVNAPRAELAEMAAEHAAGKAELMDEKLAYDLKGARERLQRVADQARVQLDHVEAEMADKLAALQVQADRATPDVRARVQRRIDDVRRDLGAREQKLRRAYELAQEALRT